MIVCRMLGIGLAKILNIVLNALYNWDDYFKPLGSSRNIIISIAMLLFRGMNI